MSKIELIKLMPLISNDYHIIILISLVLNLTFFHAIQEHYLPSFFKLFSDKIRNTTKLNN